DYTLYLVTDSGLIPEGLTIYDQVEAALRNGVTIVQLREKTLETKDFIERANKIHELTLKYKVPLIINDRVDVLLACGAEGLHIGQDDMDPIVARKLIGDDKILGLSCSKETEIERVIDNLEECKIDYIGIGAVFQTNTKKLKKIPFGNKGIRRLLLKLRDYKNGIGKDIKSVIIGGLNKSNIQGVLYTSSVPGKATDGVAVVSCIMGEKDAGKATTDTLDSIQKAGPWYKNIDNGENNSDFKLVPTDKSILNVQRLNPLVHHITNEVVTNFSANVTIAIGGSPIMSQLAGDFKDLKKIPNAGFLLNAGTITEITIPIQIAAIKEYNSYGVPVILDPVGCGATAARKEYMKKLLNSGHYFSVIKGNSGEILTASDIGLGVEMKGCDAIENEDNKENLIKAAKKLALEQRCVVVVSGKEDIIVDGVMEGRDINLAEYNPNTLIQRAVKIVGGHELMGKITGSGCSLGSTITTFVAARQALDTFSSVVNAVRLYNEAGYRAGIVSKGPGSFMSNFIDELYLLS
ncbi:bifunctional hydroxyethylthiazole kinase/thiamine-phosphate diphosphorylase, partial [Ascoidea rubescens DSM 1968]